MKKHMWILNIHQCSVCYCHYTCPGLGSLKAQASSKRGGRGGVAPHQLSHGVDFWATLPDDEVPHSVACCVPMPWLTSKLFRWARPVSSWLAVWILATAWFGTNLGHFGWHVEGALTMWQTCWWSPWTSGRVLLKVANPWFVFRHLSLLTCWMCPLMEVVWCRPQNVAQVVTMACTRSLDFSTVVSRGVEPCREILARVGVSHLHLSCRGCWPWTRVSFPQDFWWHLDGSWLFTEQRKSAKEWKL